MSPKTAGRPCAKQLGRRPRPSVCENAVHGGPTRNPGLKGYRPARAELAKYAEHADINVSQVAREALVDIPQIRAEFLRELRGEGRNRGRAAQALEDAPDIADEFASLTDDADDAVRLVAYRVLLRAQRAPGDLRAALKRERSPKIRRAILTVGVPDEAARGISQDRAAWDFDQEVRRIATSRLRRAEPRTPLRDALRHAAILGEEVTAFVRSPQRLEESRRPELFSKVLAWVCAKLVSTLSPGLVSAEAESRIDALDILFGELADETLKVEAIRIRLAMDAVSLHRNRNVWPCANVILAWDVARHLVGRNPRSILLACTDTAFDDLDFPTAASARLWLGPTFFGFQLATQD